MLYGAAIASSLALALVAARDQTVRLSSLDLRHIQQGWGTAQRDRSVTETVLSIGGQTFDFGVGSHARSAICLKLDGKATRFTARCGVDDNAKSDQASVQFKAVADGKIVWRTPVMRWKQPAEPCSLDLKGVRTLVLLATDAGDGIGYDHADWANALIEFAGRPPALIPVPEERRTVMTPKPGPKPRITGPKVFGVRPGSPMLFTVTATGARPMAFSARGLPGGLSIDAKSGMISGRLPRSGTFKVPIQAKNRYGTATRELTIECGDRLALTPHLGWNSWYIWDTRVTDEVMRKAADAIVSTGLRDHGWCYVNIDDGWSVKPNSADPILGGEPRDAQGKIRANGKFPDMKALTDYIHAKGLKAGIYTSPGPTTCAGFTGTYGHEALDAERFAEWGFDFLKYDWCSYRAEAEGLEGLQKPYAMMGGILREQPRDIVLNLCQYGMGDVWRWGKQVGGHSWRTAGDLGIGYTMFQDVFDLYAVKGLHEFNGPGAWNDPDYLLVGYVSDWNGGSRPTPFSPNEQVVQVSLWSLLSAPMILSGDVARLDEFTLSLLTNDEVLDVNQDPLGRAARRMSFDAEQETEVWAKELDDGSLAVGLFNRGEVQSDVIAKWSDLGLEGKRRVRDLWRQRDVGVREGSVSFPVPRHGVVLLKISDVR